MVDAVKAAGGDEGAQPEIVICDDCADAVTKGLVRRRVSEQKCSGSDMVVVVVKQASASVNLDRGHGHR